MTFDRKAYMKEYHKKDYKENKDKLDAKNREYYDTHKEEITSYKKDWYLEKKEKISSKNKRRWAKLTKDERRTLKLRELYGISLNDYNIIFAEQGGKCAICNKDQEDERLPLHVDHNHLTGKIRGLLCQKCNQGLGLFNDDVDIMNNAVKYINKFLGIGLAK